MQIAQTGVSASFDKWDFETRRASHRFPSIRDEYNRLVRDGTSRTTTAFLEAFEKRLAPTPKGKTAASSGADTKRADGEQTQNKKSTTTPNKAIPPEFVAKPRTSSRSTAGSDAANNKAEGQQTKKSPVVSSTSGKRTEKGVASGPEAGGASRQGEDLTKPADKPSGQQTTQGKAAVLPEFVPRPHPGRAPAKSEPNSGEAEASKTPTARQGESRVPQNANIQASGPASSRPSPKWTQEELTLYMEQMKLQNAPGFLLRLDKPQDNRYATRAHMDPMAPMS